MSDVNKARVCYRSRTEMVSDSVTGKTTPKISVRSLHSNLLPVRCEERLKGTKWRIEQVDWRLMGQTQVT